jgi:hypothetical protein
LTAIEHNRAGRRRAPLWIKTAQGNVEVWALGEDRFAIKSPEGEQVVVGSRGGPP